MHTWTVTDIARRVRSGEVSARAVAEAFMARRAAVDPRVHAWTALDDDYVRRQADAVDAREDRGALAGVPFGIKDVINTEVFPTQRGSKLWEGYRAGNDARCVYHVRQNGGVVMGKTDTAEFAVHTPGRVLNPYNPAHVTGTSSGGSAVAVATGMVPAAFGTQTLGSTIRPASWCGVYAMKPSFGLIPRTGVLKTTDTLDNMGLFARSAGDLSLILEHVRVRGANYPFVERHFQGAMAADAPVRIGVYRTHLWDQTSEEALAALEGFATALSGVDGVRVVDFVAPPAVAQVHALHRRVYNPCLAYYFREELARNRGEISQRFMELVEDGKTIAPEDYAEALREQERLSGVVHEAVRAQGIDAMVSLSSNGAAPLGVEPDFNADINVLWTMCWMPSVNVPAFRSRVGLPFGALFAAPRYHDQRLLSVIARLARAGVVPETGPLVDPVALPMQETISMNPLVV